MCYAVGVKPKKRLRQVNKIDMCVSWFAAVSLLWHWLPCVCVCRMTGCSGSSVRLSWLSLCSEAPYRLAMDHRVRADSSGWLSDRELITGMTFIHTHASPHARPITHAVNRPTARGHTRIDARAQTCGARTRPKNTRLAHAHKLWLPLVILSISLSMSRTSLLPPLSISPSICRTAVFSPLWTPAERLAHCFIPTLCKSAAIDSDGKHAIPFFTSHF